MKRKVLSLVLVLALCVGLASPAFAATSSVSDYAGVNMTVGERRIYNGLEQLVLDVFEGRTYDTTTTITLGEREYGWTAQELGFSRLVNDQATIDAVSARLNESLTKIYVALEYNHPYELFFTVWNSFSYTYDWWNTGSELWLTDITLSMVVSPDYQWASPTGDWDPSFKVNIYEQVAAKNGQELAQRIVDENAGKSNYEKLQAYCAEICRLTDYDDERMSKYHTDQYVYGRQCQASSVFDGNQSTLTVCEGYAKAFKYLCDLTDWDGDVRCYLAEGFIDTGNGNPENNGHMWNVVRMEDGRYYLTDITIYETGGYGPNVPLLACSNEDPASYNYQQILYYYGDWNYGLFTNGWLPNISETPYQPGHKVDNTPMPTPTLPPLTNTSATPSAEPTQVSTPTPTPSAAPTSTPNTAATVGGFGDVHAGDFFADPVMWAVERGITNGTSANAFSPADVCNRAQILTFLWRASGYPEPTVSNPFSDINSSDYYYKAALWASEKGMVSGSMFNPTIPCTRASTVEYMWKAAGRPTPSTTASFEDVSSDAYYAQAVAWAVENEVTKGTGATTFSPYDTCTRGQIVTFLYRAFGK